LRWGRPLYDSRRYVDHISEQVVPFAKAYARMNRYSHFYTLIFRERLVKFQELAFDLDSRTYGRCRIREFRHGGVANGLDHFAAMLLYRARGQLIMTMDHHQPSRIAIALKIAGRAHDVSE
jgi:hypothetical protein